ncbi:hypothetical protein HZB00_00140, partial [Candidatus Woesearchaeota archaeon]|nr:hypothetical protein [Candidatus Woesearchaeota archaeon]
MTTTLLSKQEKKRIFQLIKKQWDIDISKENWEWWISQEDKVYITNTQAGKTILTEAKNLFIENVGIYFGFFEKNTARLSIEAAQLLAPRINKNKVE